jgi:large subunit ribosomal protein L17
VRHQKNQVKLNRTASHRKALLMNQTRALIEHKKITTTLAKAKATRSYAERLITFAKKDDVAARRQVLKKLHSRDAVKTLFHEIGPRFRERNGGYTRIIKLENRGGDNAPMAILELVGFAVDEPVKASRKRRRPAGKAAPKREARPVIEKKAEPEVAEEATEEAVEADATEEVVEEAAAEATETEAEAVEAETEEAPVEAAAEEEVVAEEVAEVVEEAPVEEEKKPEVKAEAVEEVAEEAAEEPADEAADEGEEEEKKD